MNATAKIRDLGALEVRVEQRTREVRAPRSASVLGRLLVEDGRRVSVDALIDATWPQDHNPRDRRRALEGQIARLRALLGGASGRGHHILAFDHSGYRLLLDEDDIDSRCFVRAVDTIGQLLGEGRAREALEQADKAAALWRGEPFGPLADCDWARPHATQMQERNARLQTLRVDALLAVGAHSDALSHLAPLFEAGVLNERPWEQGALAMYQLGRVPEALDLLMRFRRLLVDEAGLAPGPRMLDLHRRILIRDTSLDAADDQARPTMLQGPRRSAEVPDLLDRDRDVRSLIELLGRASVVTLSGPPGAGTTAVAQVVADGWQSGRVSWEDLRDQKDTTRVANGLDGGADLVVLDHVDHLADELHTLLPVAAGGPRVLLVAREPLALECERVYRIAPLPLGAPARGRPSPATALLLRRLTELGGTVDEAVRSAAPGIAAAVDGVPLALVAAADRLLTFSAAEVLDQARSHPSTLGRPRRGERRAPVQESVDRIYRLLPEREQNVHRAVSATPEPFSAADVVALTGLDPAETLQCLDRLVQAALLSPRPPPAGGPTHFVQLATVRDHSRRCTHTAPTKR